MTPVLDIEEAVEFPHNKMNKTFRKESHGNFQAAPVPKFSRNGPIRDVRPLPRMGQHTISVLSDFGLAEDEITSLMKKGVLVSSSKL